MNAISVTIRDADPGDLDSIADVHRRARATYYEGHLPEEAYNGPDELRRCREGTERAIGSADRKVLCVLREDRVVAFAVLGFRPGEEKLFQFHVDPELWRAGLGSALHRACVTAWQDAAVTAARLEVFGPNRRAQAFYARQGWAEDSHVDDHVTMSLAVPSR
ncbi:GNAT family N-acetyltransferase [Streptomyces sp. SID13666]|uniref:GNAT family N-acetyltransferase n=1 Tax=unclassified Streptomyces TaxID=2593676 RepID=UPI0013C0B2B7|nr:MULTISPECIES: GNAT family N-acetyltransferase [unclassified Streptomyces]NEA56864.1 GNAT family N-acetyltransferase [Streptomyces sp. SID13666]NEA72688.1 GNAT family N-acetyltransferase [Streptomyces sp. SID13588]